MKIISNFVNLGHNDVKASSLILNSLEGCAYEHILSRKIWERVLAAKGEMFAIFGSGLNLELLSSYDSCWPPLDEEDFHYEGATHERTSERLVQFIVDYQ